MPDNENDSAGRPSASEWMASNKWPELLPTPWLTDSELEDFVEVLLNADKLLGPGVRHVKEVARWGVPGDQQDGIDFFGRFNDDVTAAWQVKQLVELTVPKVKAAVRAMTFKNAKELNLVYGGVAKKKAREEMLNHEGWTLLDRRTLTEMVRLLPAHTQRELIERFFGRDVRRQFVTAPDDSFVSLDAFAQQRLNPDSILNDLGPLAGRDTELEKFAEALDRDNDTFRQIIVVAGPGGRGKSRLLVEALKAQQAKSPNVPVICLAAGHSLTPEAMHELRDIPSIVVIDDAHNDPAPLAPLLAEVRKGSNIQVALATRPSSLRAVKSLVNGAEFGPNQRTVINVTELELGKARKLVKGLVKDLGLSFDLRNYLAEQATHSPHVAVLLTNLIRTQQLNGAIAVDENLRDLALRKYEDVLLAEIDGFPTNTIREVIATYASLQTVDKTNDDVRERIATFNSLTPIDLAKVVRIVTDRGIIIEHGDNLRVVPELLADQVVESVAAFEEHDTGFVTRLWDEFSHDHHHRLATSLGELDWRLTHTGGPSVMKPIWAAIRQRLSTPYCNRLVDDLGHLDRLANTQPSETVAVLDELRARLNTEDEAGTSVVNDPDESQISRYFRIKPRDRDDVRDKMPALYARAAMADPNLLESVLDALWDIRRRDPRPEHSTPNGAERMLKDRLANLARLPDPSFPERITAHVKTLLEQPPHPDDVATPLFALKPLLAKDALETTQSTFRSLSFQPHLISADAMRHTRDKIRDILTTQALREDLTLAGEARQLLGEALRAAHGYFGQTVTADDITQWEADDLATITALNTIADQTTSPVVRRQVREVVSWTSEHATSLPLQHAAKVLVYKLDTITTLEDQVAELVLTGNWGRSLERVDTLPTLEELQAQRQATTDAANGLTDEEAQAARQEDIRKRVEGRDAYAKERNSRLVTRLLDEHTPAEIVELLDRYTRDATALKKNNGHTLYGVWNETETQAPHLLGQFADAIANNPPGPFDDNLSLILIRWATHDPNAATTWVQQHATTGRTEVRHAIAQAHSNGNWHETLPDLTSTWAQGLNDPDPQVAQTFLGGAAGHLRANPTTGPQTLLDHNITPSVATKVLDDLTHYDGNTYGTNLTEEHATALLPLITRAGLDNHRNHGVITGIATTHPELILNHLHHQATNEPDQPLPDDIDGLSAAYDTHATTLATWIHAHLDMPDIAGRVLEAATNDHLTPSQANALTNLTSALTGTETWNLLNFLAGINIWAIRHPKLAEALLNRASEHNDRERALDRITQDCTHLNGWMFENGVSKELNNARDKATGAAGATIHPDLKVIYETAAERFQHDIDEMAKEHQQEEDDDW